MVPYRLWAVVQFGLRGNGRLGKDFSHPLEMTYKSQSVISNEERSFRIAPLSGCEVFLTAEWRSL